MKTLIVDDEDILRISLCDDLKEVGYNATSSKNPLLALDLLDNENFDVIITDLKMPEMNGITFLKQVKETNPEIIVILMTAYGTVQTAVEAMKFGAYDYLTKPFSTDELILILKRIEEIQSIKKENITLREQLKERHSFYNIIGKSKPMQEIYKLLPIVANSNSTVLITGETGAGKEMVADVIHYSSPRHSKPYIKVNCAILSKDVLESELFGHEKGAFTGAIIEKKGRFELADGGTIFLDDIDDIPLELQVKLLRILHDKQFERVGGTKTIQVATRIIASSKADLLEKIKQGKFREDLFYRLNVVPIHLPPLRDRKEDIPLLTEAFIKKYSNKPIEIPNQAMNYLLSYNWPGNIRELENTIERLALIASQETIDLHHLPREIVCQENCIPEPALNEKPYSQIIKEIEISLIKKALRITGGNKNKAGKLLKLKPSTLRSKIEKYKL